MDAEGGPHLYVVGSHRINKLVTCEAIADGIVEQTFERDRILAIGGEIGTVFLADTFGIHKGALPLRIPRLIASAQYSSLTSPHAPTKTIANRSDPAFAGLMSDPFVNRHFIA